jgi:excisionase family DNA binding protein
MNRQLHALAPNAGDSIGDLQSIPTVAIEQSQKLGVEVGDLVRRMFCLFMAPTPAKPNRLLNAQEVAKLLNTNAQVVYRLARSQELPAVNLGERMLRFTELSVSEFINRGGVSRAV